MVADRGPSARIIDTVVRRAIQLMSRPEETCWAAVRARSSACASALLSVFRLDVHMLALLKLVVENTMMGKWQCLLHLCIEYFEEKNASQT